MTGIMWPPMAPVLAKKSGSMRAEPALDSTRVVPFEDGPKRSAWSVSSTATHTNALVSKTRNTSTLHKMIPLMPDLVFQI